MFPRFGRENRRCREDGGVGLELRREELDLFELIELRVHAEVDIGEMEDPDGHQTTRTR